MAPMQFYVATEYMLGDHSSEPFCQSGRVPVGTAMLNLAASSVGLAVVDAGTGNMDCLFHAVEAVADMQPHLFTDNGPGWKAGLPSRRLQLCWVKRGQSATCAGTCPTTGPLTFIMS